MRSESEPEKRPRKPLIKLARNETFLLVVAVVQVLPQLALAEVHDDKVA